MILCEAILMTVLVMVGGYTIYTDVKRGIIENRVVMFAIIMGIVVNIFYLSIFENKLLQIYMKKSMAEIHDTITQSKESFKQTDRGVKNLLEEKQKVEIRIVISQKNIFCMTETARYIVENYKGVFCVNFIGMEMMGNAVINKDNIWVEYSEAFQRARSAIDLLVMAGIDVQLYNFPLCALDRGYWHIAAKSITDYKVRFMEECSDCIVKEICGGFFNSTKQVMKPKVVPIRKENED